MKKENESALKKVKIKYTPRTLVMTGKYARPSLIYLNSICQVCRSDTYMTPRSDTYMTPIKFFSKSLYENIRAIFTHPTTRPDSLT
jgi:hypothetical protein